MLNLNQIIRQVVNQLPALPETLVLETDLADGLMNVKGGPAQLFRAVSNLISNALEAMQEVGRLTLTTENYYVDEMAGKYGRVPKGEYVKLTVADTGSGIPHVVINKIFEPFFTTKTTDRRRGSGLGLSVVHSVVEDHHGFVDYETELGRGTSFFVYFPVSREENAGSEPETEHIIGGTETVLVVDDDWVQRDVTITLLEKLGYQATAVESGEDALHRLKESDVDLVILDMIMPGGIDGTETYRRILETKPDQRALIVSGYAESERVQEALRLGSGGFVRKPLTLKSIAGAVRRELDRVRGDD